jgi:hypothetical protein
VCDLQVLAHYGYILAERGGSGVQAISLQFCGLYMVSKMMIILRTLIFVTALYDDSS